MRIYRKKRKEGREGGREGGKVEETEGGCKKERKEGKKEGGSKRVREREPEKDTGGLHTYQQNKLIEVEHFSI